MKYDTSLPKTAGQLAANGDLVDRHDGVINPSRALPIGLLISQQVANSGRNAKPIASRGVGVSVPPLLLSGNSSGCIRPSVPRSH